MLRPLFYVLDGRGEAVPEPDHKKRLEFYTRIELERDLLTVARDRVGGCLVSTVFLMCDHQFGDGPPRLFETAVLTGGKATDRWRTSTRAEALAQHAEVVAQVRAGKERA